MLMELKNQIESIKNINDINQLKSKIKVFNYIINDIINENNNNKKNIHNLLTSNNDEIKNNINNSNNNVNQIIKGTFNVDDIFKNITIFNQCIDDEGFEVYINNDKVDIIKTYRIQYKYFKSHGEGNYDFKIIFKNNISNLKRLFEDCSDLISLDLSNFDTSNVTDMELMFNECIKLKTINGLNKLNTSQVTNMGGMFQKCFKIEYLDLTNFDTSNVTDIGDMFNKCYELKNINGLDNFNTYKVSIMSRMFLRCEKIENLDLSKFYTSNVTDLSSMFYGCNKLKSLNLLNFSLKSGCYTENIFYFENKDNCKFITNDKALKKLFYS